MNATQQHNIYDSDDDSQAMFTPVTHSQTPKDMDSIQHDTQAISTPISYSQTRKRAVSDELALDWVAPPPAKRSCPSNFRVVVPAQAYPASLYKTSSDASQKRDQNTERWALPRLLVSPPL